MDAILKASTDIQKYASQVQNLVKEVTPLCEEADYVKQDGVSLLHVKYATLMRYNLNLARLALSRVRGENISELATKLVEDSVVLNKLRPIERKLQHHIDMLLGNAVGGGSARGGINDEEAQLRPNPADVVVDGADEDGEAEGRVDNFDDDGKYKPPRLAEVVYDGTAERKRLRKEREKERFRERALRSEGIREIVSDIKGLPEQVNVEGVADDSKSSRAVQQLRREDAIRRRYEESHFTRLTVSNKDRKRRREIERAAEAEAIDGSSEFAGLSAMADRVTGRKAKRNRGRKGKAGYEDVDEEFRMHKLDEVLENA